MELLDTAKAHGTFQILSVKNGKVVFESEVMENLLLNAYWALLVQHNAGTAASALKFTTLDIGSGSTAVAPGDTALDTMVLNGIIPARTTPATASIVIEFFITDAELANGTYRELGMRCASTLVTRALFTTPYVKASGRDTIIRYTVSYTST
ncbi:hypothetical protein [Novosphingobium aquae]|uniref:Uncharacterized protein n=1 Tax=Novosphingobium aquae TaxID=3133435 RepID=A0ABU8SBU6_9SPHN